MASIVPLCVPHWGSCRMDRGMVHSRTLCIGVTMSRQTPSYGTLTRMVTCYKVSRGADSASAGVCSHACNCSVVKASRLSWPLRASESVTLPSTRFKSSAIALLEPSAIAALTREATRASCESAAARLIRCVRLSFASSDACSRCATLAALASLDA